MQRTLYDEDHEAFRDSVRTWLERSVIPDAEKHISEKALPRDFWLEAGRQGFLGLEIPEEYGGSGAEDFRFVAILNEELAKGNAALPTCVGIHANITAPYLIAYGTEEQRTGAIFNHREAVGIEVLKAKGYSTTQVTDQIHRRLPKLQAQLPAGAKLEVVQDAGILVSPDNPEQWAQAMREMIDDDPMRKRVIEAGYERAGQFTWTRSAEILEDAYNHALDTTL
jgi:hypothetical protein